jgi:hypothetical protein
MKSIIFNISEINKVNFTEVTQTLQTLTYTKTCVIIERKTYVTWTSLLPPSFVSTMTTAEGPYTQSELLSIISGPDWLVLV